MRHFAGYATAILAMAACTRAKGPEVYGAGVFTTSGWDFAMALSPDQKNVFLCHADPTFNAYDIYETRLGPDGHWSLPSKPRFATQWSNADPAISPDGKTVFFISNRPIAKGETAPRAIHDLWYAERQPDGSWGDAERLPAKFNEANVDIWHPSVARNGNLYFGAELPGGKGRSDLWVSRRVDGIYREPENLGDALNTREQEVEAWIAPDESYMIVSALNRPDGKGSYDLYLSRRIDGAWERARPLSWLNTPAYEFTPTGSPDGKWLYFSSTRADGKTGDLYRVPMSDVLDP